MRSVGAERGQVGVHASAMGAAIRAPAHVPLDNPHLCVRVLVCLAERDPGPHVKQVPHSRTVVPGAGDVGHVTGDRCVGVKPPLLGEDACDATDDGLGNRHQQVWRVGPHPPEVSIKHDPAVVHDEDGVGPGVREHRAERRMAGLETSDSDVIRHKRSVSILQRP